MNTALQDRPLFRSLDQCLRYAWRNQPRMVKPPAIMQLAGVDEREGAPAPGEEKEPAPPRILNFDLDRKPTGLDAAGQMGLLQSFVRRQPAPERYHLSAKYAGGEERKDAQRALRDYLLPLINQVLRPRHLVYVLVGRYYGRRDVVFKDWAVKLLYLVPQQENPVERMQEAWRMVRDLAADIDGLLADLAARTEDLAVAELRERGVIA